MTGGYDMDEIRCLGTDRCGGCASEALNSEAN